MLRKTASIWEKSKKNFLMILPLFFEHFIRICVFRSFSFFLTAFFSMSYQLTFFLFFAHFIFAISRICELLNCARCGPCVSECTHIAHYYLSVLLKEVLLFPKYIFSRPENANKEAERKKWLNFLAITQKKIEKLAGDSEIWHFSHVTTYRKCKKFNFLKLSIFSIYCKIS